MYALGREGEASCEDIPLPPTEPDVTLSRHPALRTRISVACSRASRQGYGLNQVVVVSTLAASAHPPHPTTDSRALPPFTRPVRNPAAVTRALSSAAVHPLYRDGCPDHYVERSATTAALSPCGPPGVHDARLGDPVFARLRSSDAIRRPVRPFDPTDGGQAAPAGSRASRAHRSLRAGSHVHSGFRAG